MEITRRSKLLDVLKAYHFSEERLLNSVHVCREVERRHQRTVRVTRRSIRALLAKRGMAGLAPRILLAGKLSVDDAERRPTSRSLVFDRWPSVLLAISEEKTSEYSF